MSRVVLASFEAEFARYRSMAERAAAHLPWELVRTSLDPETNSIAVVMKHVAGNLRSRWTDPFTTDGEKPRRNRDDEFVDDFSDRAAMERAWNESFSLLGATLAAMTDADLGRVLTIRGEPHSLALALARSAAHTAYHAGQIVQTARVLASRNRIAWTTITIPRGGSGAFNASMNYAAGPRVTGAPASGPTPISPFPPYPSVS